MIQIRYKANLICEILIFLQKTLNLSGYIIQIYIVYGEYLLISKMIPTFMKLVNYRFLLTAKIRG